MSQQSNAYAQIEQERRARWARRDLSIHPLTETEKSERRHHQANGWWVRLLWLGPIALAAGVGFVLGEINTPLVMAALMFAACAIAVLLFTLCNWLMPYIGGRATFLINASAMTIVAIAFAIILILSILEGELPFRPFAGSVLCACVLPAWPFLWRVLRRRFTSDYEHRLAAESAPVQGIIE